MSLESNAGREVENIVATGKEDGLISPEDKSHAEIQRSAESLKKIYNLEAGDEYKEQRNAVLSSINITAFNENVDPQVIADLIYGEGQLLILDSLEDGFADYAQPVSGLNTISEANSSFEIETIPGPFKKELLVYRASPEDALEANLFTRESDGRIFLTFRPIKRGPYGETQVSPIPVEFSDRDAAIAHIYKSLQEMMHRSGYAITEIQQNHNTTPRSGRIDTDSGPINATPSNGKKRAPETRTLNPEPLINKMKTTDDSQWANDQMEVLFDWNNGIGPADEVRATIAFLENGNIDPMPERLEFIFAIFENNPAVIQAFSQIAPHRLERLATDLGEQALKVNGDAYYSPDSMVKTYKNLPKTYQKIYLSKLKIAADARPGDKSMISAYQEFLDAIK